MLHSLLTLLAFASSFLLLASCTSQPASSMPSEAEVLEWAREWTPREVAAHREAEEQLRWVQAQVTNPSPELLEWARQELRRKREAAAHAEAVRVELAERARIARESEVRLAAERAEAVEFKEKSAALAKALKDEFKERPRALGDQEPTVVAEASTTTQLPLGIRPGEQERFLTYLEEGFRIGYRDAVIWLRMEGKIPKELTEDSRLKDAATESCEKWVRHRVSLGDRRKFVIDEPQSRADWIAGFQKGFLVAYRTLAPGGVYSRPFPGASSREILWEEPSDSILRLRRQLLK